MLPPGHIAGGYLAATVLISILQPQLDNSQVNALLALGAFLGFAPDLDMFVAFFKVKAFTIPENKISHRKFYSHAPLVWLAVGILIFVIAPSPFLQYVGLLIWIGSWSHFILDSIEYGIMWLWPFSNKLYALKNPEVKTSITETGFFRYWFSFLRWYFTRLSFYLEILVIGLAIFVAWK